MRAREPHLESSFKANSKSAKDLIFDLTSEINSVWSLVKSTESLSIKRSATDLKLDTPLRSPRLSVKTPSTLKIIPPSEVFNSKS